MLDAAEIRKHQRMLSVPVGKNGCANIPVRYHRTCQSTFTHKKDLLKQSGDDEKEDPGPSEPRRSSRDPGAGESDYYPSQTLYILQKR